MLSPKGRGFTLLEIMIILGIIGIIVAIAAPTWLRQREYSRARACQENLTKIDGAVETYATEFKLPNGAAINYPQDLIQPGGAAVGQGYLRAAPECPANGEYSVAAVGELPECSVKDSFPGYPPHEIPAFY